MITLIEAKNFRCLRYIRQPLGDFHVLVGPNASGKTTFLDVVAFLGQLVSEGLDAAIGERTQNFEDLLWNRSGNGFELAVEVGIPMQFRPILRDKTLDTARYEVAIGMDRTTGEVVIEGEKVLLRREQNAPQESDQRELFPSYLEPPATILTPRNMRSAQTVVTKVSGGNDNFYSEVYAEKGKGWAPAYKLGNRKSALGNLPEDESKFPVSTWLKRLLSDGVQKLVLNSQHIRKASPPGKGRGFRPDGSNLPWVVEELRRTNPERLQDWIGHVQTALPDLESIRTIERPDDKHRYLMLGYAGGLKVPSWMASDGTLRLLALTLPAYLPELGGVFLVEEPENGIHPRAVETLFQSLSSVYDAQILLASHSPVILSIVDPSKVLCFAKTQEGSTDIVQGNHHPALKEWRGEASFGVLFAGGVLG
jgi:predicted ATPase